MTAPSTALEFQPLSESLGVEILGLDLRRPMSVLEREHLKQLYDEHHLLYLRCPGLDSDSHLEFSKIFGPLFGEIPGQFVQYVSNHREDRIIDEGALLFHSDLAFTPVPVLGLSLFALEIPEAGAQTSFANAARAWSRLSESLRAQLSELHARHLFNLTTQRGDVPYRDEDLPEREPRAEHPVRMLHPRNGREILYVSEMQTDRIVELSQGESNAVLADLFGQLYSEENVYEHSWQEGDLLIWDNLAVQHARPDMPVGAARTLRRITLATAGVADQVKWFRRSD
ncbi:TauD/TfdA family dioxygenase [Myxococcota bacterium]|nr:TauD/TfdA family dioxygenase [Myxococcota bacterium]